VTASTRSWMLTILLLTLVVARSVSPDSSLAAMTQPRPATPARAADLLADYGRRISGPDGARMPLEVRDAINVAHDEDRCRELVLALLQVVDNTWPGIFGRNDVQQTLTLTSIASQQQLGPPLH
jgi:hypothetical protein